MSDEEESKIKAVAEELSGIWARAHDGCPSLGLRAQRDAAWRAVAKYVIDTARSRV